MAKRKRVTKVKRIWIQPLDLEALKKRPTFGLFGAAYYGASIYDYPRIGCIELRVGKRVPRR